MSEQATAAKLPRPASNLALWESARTPNPKFTKEFTRGGGFKGTTINVVYLIRCATELWGPMGGNWGVTVVDECVHDGAPLLGKDGGVIGCEKLHVVRIELRHPGGSVPAYGQTMMVGANKYGPFTDEEAPKKSLTDALSKALSWLGFAADVHMGIWDDSKYVNDAREAFKGERVQVAKQAEPRQALKDEDVQRLRANLIVAARRGPESLKHMFLEQKDEPGLAALWKAEGETFKAIAAKAVAGKVAQEQPA